MIIELKPNSDASLEEMYDLLGLLSDGDDAREVQSLAARMPHSSLMVRQWLRHLPELLRDESAFLAEASTVLQACDEVREEHPSMDSPFNMRIDFASMQIRLSVAMFLGKYPHVMETLRHSFKAMIQREIGEAA